MTTLPTRIALGILLALAVLALASAGAEPSPVHGDAPLDGYVHDQVVVRVLDPDDLDAINSDFGTTTVDDIAWQGGSVSSGIYLLESPSGEDSAITAAELAADARVAWAEPNLRHGTKGDDGDGTLASGTSTLASGAFTPVELFAGGTEAVLNSEPDPGPSCTIRTDWDAAGCDGTFTASSLADLNAYVASDFGRSGGADYKNLKINADLTDVGGDLVIESPCQISIVQGVELTADSVKLDGREGVVNSYGYEVHADTACVLSEAGHAGFGTNSVIDVGALTIQALKRAKVGKNSTTTVEGALRIVSTGTLLSSTATIKENAVVTAGSIALEAVRTADLGKNLIVTADGLVSLISTGNLTASTAGVKEGTQLTAGALEVSSPRGSTLGENTLIRTYGDLSVVSTGSGTGESIVRSGANVAVGGRMVLTSTNKATLGTNTTTDVGRRLRMSANTPAKCSIASTAVVKYRAMKGNCTDPNGTSHGTPERRYRWFSVGPGQYFDQPSLGLVGLDTAGGHAHSFGTGDGAQVAIIDTGAVAHPYLGGVEFVGFDYLDGNEDVNDVPDQADNDGDGDKDEAAGHGTFVAGIVNLVAPDAEVRVYRVLDSDGVGYSFNVANAVIRSTDHGANVINLSLILFEESQALNDAVDYATAAGALVIGAVGNEANDVPLYPADHACVLGVTSVGPGNLKSTFANWGTSVDVAAPGEDIYSTFLDLDGGTTPTDGEYAYWDGTSIASPFIAGQAALIRSEDPTLTPQEVASLIANTAVPLDGYNPAYAGGLGAGLANVYASMAYLQQPSPVIAPSALLGCAQ